MSEFVDLKLEDLSLTLVAGYGQYKPNLHIKERESFCCGSFTVRMSIVGASNWCQLQLDSGGKKFEAQEIFVCAEESDGENYTGDLRVIKHGFPTRSIEEKFFFEGGVLSYKIPPEVIECSYEYLKNEEMRASKSTHGLIYNFDEEDGTTSPTILYTTHCDDHSLSYVTIHTYPRQGKIIKTTVSWCWGVG